MNKILFVQFSNSMFLRHNECDNYWSTFYKHWEKIGYYVGSQTFEIPKWIAEISYFSEKYDKHILWCKHNIQEVLNEINKEKYDYVLFSLMNANQFFIDKIIEKCPKQNFVIGGYNKKFLTLLSQKYDNVTICDTTKDTANAIGCEYKFGTNYALFNGEKTIPRLTLSYGCLNKCKFCIVPHGKIINVPHDVIKQQITSFRDLQYKLIYIDDKTFGQANNFKCLYDLTKQRNNQNFNGYIVQTTSGMTVRNAKTFSEIGVKVIEIGLETYNDDILRKYNKPSSEKMIGRAINACKENNLLMIPNIIIGLPEETEETYTRTYDFVMPLLQKGKIIGINPAIYTDYENDENLGEIDFLSDEKTEMHRKWWKKFNETAAQILS